MTIAEYLEALKERLLTDPLVTAFQVTRERQTPIAGYMRARLTIRDGSRLEFSEYVRQVAEDRIEVGTYSYHWADAQGKLIRRWDNTPHFPDLPGYPHHVHDGKEDAVHPGQPITLFTVLDVLAKRIS